MEYPIEELQEVLAHNPLFRIMGYGLLEQIISKDRLIDIVSMCSDVIHKERVDRGGRFKIDKIVKDTLEITKVQLEIDLEDIIDEIEDNQEEVFPRKYRDIIRNEQP